MKIIFSFVFIFALATVGAAQRKQTRKPKPKQPTAYALLDDIKQLKPAQTQIYLDVLKKLDAADSSFAVVLDAQKFSTSVKRAFDFYTENSSSLPDSKLKKSFALLILNYTDAAVLLELGDARAQGKEITLTAEQEEFLGEAQRRYNLLLKIPTSENLTSIKNVSKIYASAVNLKKGMYSFFGQ